MFPLNKFLMSTYRIDNKRETRKISYLNIIIMTQKIPSIITAVKNPEIQREDAIELLNKVNIKRAGVAEQHIGVPKEQVYQYLTVDNFEDLPPAFHPIIEGILTETLCDPTFGNEESASAELFGAMMDLDDICSDDTIPSNYQSILGNVDSQLGLREVVSHARTMALLYQQYQDPTPEDHIKNNVLEEIARYCAVNCIEVPTEIIRELKPQTVTVMLKLWRKQEERHQRMIHEEIMEVDRFGNHIKEGVLPKTAILNSRHAREQIAQILNLADPEAADKKRAAIYARHKGATAEKNKRFKSFYNFVKGPECFTERIFRFQEGVIDVNNF